MNAEYLVHRWRAFVAPGDLLTMVLLLCSGAKFTRRRAPLMPVSPAAERVYLDRVHVTVDSWPYPIPPTGYTSLFETESEGGGMLDVFRFMDRRTGTVGQFVSLLTARSWETTPYLAVGDTGWFCDNANIALYTAIGEKPNKTNTAAALLRPLINAHAPFSADERESGRKALWWDPISNAGRVRIEGVVPKAKRQATSAFDDPIWTAEPQPPGTDLMFDEATARVHYTNFLMFIE